MKQPIRKPKKNCKICHGTGGVVIDEDSMPYGDTVISFPVYEDCECLKRWYDSLREWWSA